MKEFIEKLIGRLEEISVSRDNDGVINGCNMGVCEDDDCLKCLKKKVISIVNQLAEEYNNESVKGDLISRSALIKELNDIYLDNPYDDKEDILEKAIGIVDHFPTAYNYGWIPCSEKPEENQTVMLTFKNSAGLHVGEATYKNNMFFYITDTEFGYYEEVYKNPIAWMPLPPAYVSEEGRG